MPFMTSWNFSVNRWTFPQCILFRQTNTLLSNISASLGHLQGACESNSYGILWHSVPVYRSVYMCAFYWHVCSKL